MNINATEGSMCSVVIHDEHDARAAAETLAMYPRLAQAVAATVQTLPTAPALVEDLFYGVYCASPRLRPVEELAPSARINRAILAQLMSTTAWHSIRAAGTVGDQLYSGIATATVSRSVLAALEEKTVQLLRQLHEAEGAAKTLRAQAETLADLAAQTEGDRARMLSQQAQQARMVAEEQQQRARDLADALEEEQEGIEDATRRAARGGLDQAEAELAATTAAIKTFSGGYDRRAGMGAVAPGLTLQEKMDLATRVGQSPRLREIAEMVGRVTRIALRVQETRVTHPPDEVVGITVGDDLARVLPAETALLSDPALESQFFLRYAEKRLMQLDLVGRERQGRGPIIVALDSSASMCDRLGRGPSKDAWAKAVTLALLTVARKQKRDVAVVHFSGVGQVKVHEFARGESSPAQLIAMAEFFYGSGTVYAGWMAEALRLAEGSMFDRADVICVSDAEVGLDDHAAANWNTRRRARDMRCYGVLLSDLAGGDVLGRLCDAVVTVDDLAQDGAALRVMFSV
jgi:uncharacterized protein with von Willebrand factor type A (vWA) domain